MTSHLAEELNSLDDRTKEPLSGSKLVAAHYILQTHQIRPGEIVFCIILQTRLFTSTSYTRLYSPQPSMHRRNRKSFFILPGIGNRGSVRGWVIFLKTHRMKTDECDNRVKKAPGGVHTPQKQTNTCCPPPEGPVESRAVSEARPLCYHGP